MKGNQVLVNAHIMLANLGSDAYVLNVDPDEYLVSDNSTTLEELFDGCCGNMTACVPRCAHAASRAFMTLESASLSALGLRVGSRHG